jgi:NADPH:quinone reductase-like Zn-dependent oxidoreductase
MARMNAAVVTSFAEPPHYQPFEVPQPNAADEFVVDVLAVGLHPRVRSGAAGAHYTSSGTLPMIPGVDAVGQRPDGTRVYFVAADDVIGTMADKALASAHRSIELPGDADIAKVAAAMNPAMSSWVALRRRVPIQPGQSVLVLGATGNAGAMAVQVARRWSCRQPRCVRPASGFRAGARAPYRRGPTWPSCRRWSPRSPRARSR